MFWLKKDRCTPDKTSISLSHAPSSIYITRFACFLISINPNSIVFPGRPNRVQSARKRRKTRRRDQWIWLVNQRITAIEFNWGESSTELNESGIVEGTNQERSKIDDNEINAWMEGDDKRGKRENIDEETVDNKTTKSRKSRINATSSRTIRNQRSVCRGRPGHQIRDPWDLTDEKRQVPVYSRSSSISTFFDLISSLPLVPILLQHRTRRAPANLRGLRDDGEREFRENVHAGRLNSHDYYSRRL